MDLPYRSGRLVVLADLHIDAWLRAERDPLQELGLADLIAEADALIIAGDLIDGLERTWRIAFANLAQYIPLRRVYLVPGNHEYAGAPAGLDVPLAYVTQKAGARLAQMKVLHHGATRIACATLWTDYDLLGDPKRAMRRARRELPDHVDVLRPRTDDDLPPLAKNRAVRPSELLTLHQAHRAWIEEALAEPHLHGSVGRTIIVTHHGPHPSTAGPLDGLSPAFHSDLSGIIDRFRPEGWFFGHSHRPLRASVGATDIRNVSVGYPRLLAPDDGATLRAACIWESRNG